MIDPHNVIKFDRTDAELEEWWLFSTIVAGKTAATQAKLLDRFLLRARIVNGPTIRAETPFQYLQVTSGMVMANGKTLMRNLMEECRIGQYSRLERCWTESLALDLRNDPVEAFEAIYGVGPKTARMFIMHSRPDQRLAAIDTHVLKHLRAMGFANVPKATPPAGEKYRELEEAFLGLADAAGQSPADYDLNVWRSYATHKG